MSKTVTITFSATERDELVRGLVLLKNASAVIDNAPPSLATLMAKLTRASEEPQITIGVHGGQVQWTRGNPFPIRVCDYDGEDHELPDIDERHQKCRIWFEPIDDDWQTAVWRELPSLALG